MRLFYFFLRFLVGVSDYCLRDSLLNVMWKSRDFCHSLSPSLPLPPSFPPPSPSFPPPSPLPHLPFPLPPSLPLLCVSHLLSINPFISQAEDGHKLCFHTSRKVKCKLSSCLCSALYSTSFPSIDNIPQNIPVGPRLHSSSLH